MLKKNFFFHFSVVKFGSRELCDYNLNKIDPVTTNCLIVVSIWEIILFTQKFAFVYQFALSVSLYPLTGLKQIIQIKEKFETSRELCFHD